MSVDSDVYNYVAIVQRLDLLHCTHTFLPDLWLKHLPDAYLQMQENKDQIAIWHCNTLSLLHNHTNTELKQVNALQASECEQVNALQASEWENQTLRYAFPYNSPLTIAIYQNVKNLKLYFIDPSNINNINTMSMSIIDVYNCTAQKKKLHKPQITQFATLFHNNCIYFLGGMNKQKKVNECECYDTEKNCWIPMTPLPISVTQGIAFGFAHYLVLLEAFDENCLFKNFIYDFHTKIWEPAPWTLPEVNQSLIKAIPLLHPFQFGLFFQGGDIWLYSCTDPTFTNPMLLQSSRSKWGWIPFLDLTKKQTNYSYFF